MQTWDLGQSFQVILKALFLLLRLDVCRARNISLPDRSYWLDFKKNSGILCFSAKRDHLKKWSKHCHVWNKSGKDLCFQTRLPGEQTVGKALHLPPVQGESRLASTAYAEIFFVLQTLLQPLKITAAKQLAWSLWWLWDCSLNIYEYWLLGWDGFRAQDSKAPRRLCKAPRRECVEGMQQALCLCLCLSQQGH